MTVELKPCPFCGGKAERIDIEDGENAGGSCIACTRCQASSNVEFEFKENFISKWNTRSLLPGGEALERVKGLADAREAAVQKERDRDRRQGRIWDDEMLANARQWATVPHVPLADLQAILAALSTPDTQEKARG